MGSDSNAGKALVTSSGKLSPARGYGETETNLPLFHRRDKGKPRENTRARSHTAREGRPGLDAPPRVACAGLGHRPAPLPDLSSSSALREWFLTTRPLLLGEQYSCTHYLKRSAKSAGWGRHPHLVDGDTEAGREEGTCCRSLAGPTLSHFNLEKLC